MSRFQRPGRGSVVRAAFVLVLAALAAFAVGAVHGGAATPSTQSVTVPGKAGQTATVTWTGTIPAVSAHPTSELQRRRRAGRRRRARVDDPAQGLRPVRRDLHLPDQLDAEQPDRRRAAERRGADRQQPRQSGRRRHGDERGRLERRQRDDRDGRRPQPRPRHLPRARVRLRQLDAAGLPRAS